MTDPSQIQQLAQLLLAAQQSSKFRPALVYLILWKTTKPITLDLALVASPIRSK
jgi:hypothetical protein